MPFAKLNQDSEAIWAKDDQFKENTGLLSYPWDSSIKNTHLNTHQTPYKHPVNTYRQHFLLNTEWMDETVFSNCDLFMNF